jgi:hypothetical protein
MRFSTYSLFLALLLSPFTSFAQSSALTLPSGSTDVPKLVKFSGAAKDESGKLMTGPVGITFSLYMVGPDSTCTRTLKITRSTPFSPAMPTRQFRTSQSSQAKPKARM